MFISIAGNFENYNGRTHTTETARQRERQRGGKKMGEWAKGRQHEEKLAQTGGKTLETRRQRRVHVVVSRPRASAPCLPPFTPPTLPSRSRQQRGRHCHLLLLLQQQQQQQQ